MAKISNTLSYPNRSPIEGADYLIGTAANSTPIDKQTKTFTIQDIANFIIPDEKHGVKFQSPSILIKIDKYQHGWPNDDDNWKRLTKVKITLVIDRSS